MAPQQAHNKIVDINWRSSDLPEALRECPEVLLQELAEPYTHPLAVMPQKRSEWLSNLSDRFLRNNIRQDEFGFKIASFRCDFFTHSYGQLLRALGVDYIELSDYNIVNKTDFSTPEWKKEQVESPHLSFFTEEAGYYLRPDRISWGCATRSLDEHLGEMSSKQRTRLKAKRRKSNDVVLRVEPINKKNFARWHRVYQKEIVNRDRGKSHIDSHWAQSADREEYRLLSYYDHSGQRYLGGAIIYFSDEELAAVIAYAAYDSESRGLELPTRTFTETLDLAVQMGLPRVSHGWEHNLYGHHLTSGLMEFKAGLGLTPQPSNRKYLTKILSLDKFNTGLHDINNEVLFLAGENSDSFRCIQVGGDSRRLVLPRSIPQEYAPFIEIPKDDKDTHLFPEESYLAKIAMNIDELSPWQDILNVYQVPRNGMIHSKSGCSLQHYHSAIQILRGGERPAHLNTETLLDIARQFGLIPQLADSELTEKIAHIYNHSYCGKLAYYLCTHSGPGSFYDRAIPEILDKLFAETSCIRDTPRYPQRQKMSALLHNIRERHGTMGLASFTAELHRVIDLTRFFDDFDTLEELPYVAERSVLSVDDIDFKGLIKEEHVLEAKTIVERLCESLLFVEEFPFRGFKNEHFVVTEGEENISVLISFLENPEELLDSIRNVDLLEQHPHVREIAYDLRKLARMRKEDASDSEPSLEVKTFLDKLSRTSLDGIDGVHTYCYAAGLDISKVVVRGRKKYDVLYEILERATPQQLNSITHFLSEEMNEFYGSRSSAALLRALKALNLNDQHEQTNPFHITSFTGEEYQQIRKLLNGFIRVAYPHREDAMKMLQEKLQVPQRDTTMLFGENDFDEVLNEYIAKNGELPAVDEAVVTKWLRDFAEAKGDADILGKFYVLYPNTQLTEEDKVYLKEHSSYVSEENSDLWHRFALPFRLYNPTSERQELKEALSNVMNVTFILDALHVTAMGSSVPLSRFLKSLNFTNEEKTIVAEEAYDLTRRKFEQHGADDNTHQLEHVLTFAVCICHFLEQSKEPLGSFYTELARRSPVQAIKALSYVVGENTIQKPWYGELRKAFFLALKGGGSYGKWFSVFPQTSNGFLSFHWDKDANVPFGRLLTNWLSARADAQLSSDEELISFLDYHWLQNDSSDFMKLHVNTIFLYQNLKEETSKERFFSILRSAYLKHESFHYENESGPGSYSHMLEYVAALVDPNGQDEFYQRSIGNKEFISLYDWTKAGYSEEVRKRIHEYAEQPECTRLVPANLVRFLSRRFEFERYWVEQIVLNTPAKSFSNLIPLLEYANSAENLTSYAYGRVERLLKKRKMRLLTQIRSGALDEVEKKVDRLEAEGSPVPTRLFDRRDYLATYSELFSEYQNEDNSEKREQINKEINRLLFQEYKPKIVPEEEIKSMIEDHYEGFLKTIRNHKRFTPEIETFLTQHANVLTKTKIVSRLVQFSNFADQQGIDVLLEVLNGFCLLEGTQFTKRKRPDKGGKTIEHVDRSINMLELREAMLEKGLHRKAANSFLPSWELPFVFIQADTEEKDTWLTVTHDLESWIKHGDEPIQTCHTLTHKAGNMDESDWNYQFGPCGNTNGRPLARILLPQLKLAEFRVKGKIVARSVLEITVDANTNPARPHLLVEKTYADRSFVDFEHFNQTILDYAEQIGLSKDQVTFANSKEPYPSPLPEKFRILRDTFRPTADD